jgi:hypothetical protein
MLTKFISCAAKLIDSWYKYKSRNKHKDDGIVCMMAALLLRNSIWNDKHNPNSIKKE